MLPFLHVHAHTHYINTGYLTQKCALKVFKSPRLPSGCPQCTPKMSKRLFCLCNDDCGQHIHSLGMVELSAVEFVFSGARRLSETVRDHLENSPRNAGASQSSFLPILTTFLIIPFLTQLRSNVCLTSTNTTMTLHITDVSL